jgi:hypothetical protein
VPLSKIVPLTMIGLVSLRSKAAYGRVMSTVLPVLLARVNVMLGLDSSRDS